MNVSREDLEDSYFLESPEKTTYQDRRMAFRKKLAKINCCLFLIFLLFSICLLADRLLVLKSTSSRLPNKCIKEKCKVKLEMPSPEGKNFVYLRVGNFYQNYKAYTTSFSSKMFKEGVGESSLGSCRPLQTNKQMHKTEDYDGNKLKEGSVARPCGAIAFTFPQSKLSIIVQSR